MFNDKQLQLLNQELDPNRIKSRSKGNVNLSYLEGFDIIDTANRVFGYGNWSYSIKSLTQVSQETNSNQNVVVCYKAIVTLTINDLQHNTQVIREDVGFGTGIAKSLADANESAAKESVTDSLKRSLRSFGNQFGNSLYDKSRNHHNSSLNTQNSGSSNSYNQQSQYTQNQQQQTQPNQNPNNFQPSNQQTQNTQASQQLQQDIGRNYVHEYHSLYNLGLSIIEQGSNIIVVGDDIFSKKDSIKAFGFMWDKQNKIWYKPINREVA
jgi:DNA repair and recombination protein RAD52